MLAAKDVMQNEQALLGSICLRHRAILEAQKIIKPEDFFIESHRIIYQVLLDLPVTDYGVDLLQLINSIKKLNLHKPIPDDYLISLFEVIHTSAAIRYYCEQVVEYGRIRKLQGLTDLIKAGMDYHQTSDDIISQIKQALLIIDKPDNTNTVDMVAAIHHTIGAMEERRHRGSKLVGIPFGINKIDNRTGGLKNKHLVVIAGRPSSGKSVFAKDIAERAAEAGKAVLYFSLEMAREELIERHLASYSSMDYFRIQNSYYSDKDMDTFLQSASRMAELNIRYNDNSNLTIDQIISIIESDKIERDTGLVVIDYLQLITARNKQSREQEVSDMSRSLKKLAKSLNIPIVVLSQLNRKCDDRQDKRPMMSDLRESGGLEQDADLVLMLYNEHMYNEHADPEAAEIIIAKGRSVLKGICKVRFEGKYQRFVDAKDL